MKITHEQYGLAAYLCSVAKFERTVADLNHWIMPALQHKQIMFVFDKSGHPLAYWTWAFLAPDVEERFRLQPRATLHESEWNEGDAPWIMELVSHGPYLRDIVRYIRTAAFRNHDAITVRRTTTKPEERSYTIWPCKPGENYEQLASQSKYYHLYRSAFANSYSAWIGIEDKPPSGF